MFSLICFKSHNLLLFVFKRNDKVLQINLKILYIFLFHSLHFTLSSFSRHYHKLLYILLFHFGGYLHIYKCKSMNILFSNFLVIIVILQLAFSLSLFVFFLFFFLNIYLAAPGLSWHVKSLQLQHVGSSFLTRGQTWAPSVGSTEFQLLDHEESLNLFIY